MQEAKQEREYKEERFDYVLYVNDFIICKRNFKIFNFVEGSMSTLDFKYTVDEIVNEIDNDLKSKSRVYLWKYFNPEFPDAEDELVSPLIEPWTCTFKFVVYDNKREVMSKIWDGRFYPRLVRDRVDLSNKWVKITSKDGVTYSYEKEQFFKSNGDRLTFDLEVLKAMIMDKKDILFWITKHICESCSIPRGEQTSPNRLEDFTTVFQSKDGDGKTVSYNLNTKEMWRKHVDKVGKSVSKKTKEYFKNLFD